MAFVEAPDRGRTGFQPLSGTISISDIDGPLYSTSIQRDELEAVPNEEHRASLLANFQATIRLKTPAAVWDVSSWDEANFGTPEQNQFVDTFAADLRAADRQSRKRSSLKNLMRDTLIALTAREHGLVLLTGDRNLEAVAARHGISTKFMQQPD